MDIPSLFMIPSAVSSGKVHSVFPNSTDADFDFNRDSDATRVNSEGLIERVGYFGSELVTNGGFDTDSNWTKTSGAEISNGRAKIIVTGGGYQSVAQSISLSNTKKYRVTAVVNGTSGKAVTFVDNSANNGGLTTSNGVITFNGQDQNVDITWTANSNSFEIEIIRNGSGDFSFTVDNVSVKEVIGDRARLNYEIEGGLVNTKPSLLLEPQSTNLLPYSEDFTQSNWINIGSPTITPNYGISPDGTLNSTRVQFASSSNSLYDAISHTIGDTASIYVKGASGETIQFGAGANVAAGQLFTLNGEWQRIEFQSNGTSVFCIGTFQSATARNIEVFAAQLEALSYATSYIPTNGSSQTRAAETCNGAGTSSIFEDTDGILYCEIANIANNVTHSLALSDGSNANVVFIGYNPLGRLDANVRRSSAFQAVFNYTGVSDSTVFNKIAFRFQANNFQLWVNGSQVATDTSGLVPFGLTELAFDDGSGSNPFYGKIRDIRVYNTKEMTDSEVDILLTKITS
jgi:hypothetical protein